MMDIDHMDKCMFGDIGCICRIFKGLKINLGWIVCGRGSGLFKV